MTFSEPHYIAPEGMYRAFAFEGDIHRSLDCVPLSVRRKLDLAGGKISLAGWQALTRAERLALCHLPVEGDGDVAVYREVLQAFAARAGVPLKPLVDPDAEARVWNANVPPPQLAKRLAELAARLAAGPTAPSAQPGGAGIVLDPPRWRALDEEARYALFKLADPKREPAKLHAALVELGLAPGPAPAVVPDVAICARGPA
jgi:hypothetical protein